MQRALNIRKPNQVMEIAPEERNNIEGGMIRYRYGPWDPSYYAILGRLIGKELVKTISNQQGLSYRTTEKGGTIANLLGEESSWSETNQRIKLLKRNFDISGNKLKNFIYENFPEIVNTSLGEKL
ncbi:hypothetical protein Oscil6304_0591 [Oscillatoria acuminata PCC 6304]|uniref:Uncharacterized protein n=2 Tax=Oscillatoria acuminata TaxID=118323 RepID=K9TDY9_9CYAN|nr:hypothetical protein Oscil6304_0591 [Oscillatoria acuminata PCC 6304]